MNELQRIKLLSAVTEHDRKNSTKKGYNPYALAHYLIAVDNCRDLCSDGMGLRQAIVKSFCGRLMDCCLRAVGEKISTKEEQRGW